MDLDNGGACVVLGSGLDAERPLTITPVSKVLESRTRDAYGA